MEANELHTIPQERYQNEMRRNMHQIIGIVKSHFLRSLIYYDSPEKDFNIVNKLIQTHLVLVRKDRRYKRTNTKNKSRMSYRYTY